MSVVRIIAIGKTKEKWLQDAIAEYLKRVAPLQKVELVEIKEEPVGKDEARVKSEEGRRLLSAAGDGSFIIALDAAGKGFSSESFAAKLKALTQDQKRIDFLVGGALGLSEEVKRGSNLTLSLSGMTFTHQMARLILIEQIYRACMINAGRSYHK